MLLLDATANIGGVRDLVRERGLDHRQMVALTLTDMGDTAMRGADGKIHLPKRLLMGALRNQLLAGRFKVAANLPEAVKFIEELKNFEVTITSTGHDKYEARNGAHDDRVLAAAMAVWHGLTRPLPTRSEYTGFLFLMVCLFPRLVCGLCASVAATATARSAPI